MFSKSDVGLWLFIINPHVIYLHSLWPNPRIYALLTAPVAAHSNVQNQMKGLVKRPLLVVISGVFECEVFLTIDEKIDFF
jgi:hypothetical protein